MTSKIVVNNIEADSGINTVTFNSNIQGNLIGNVTGNVTGNINSTGVTTVTTLNIGTGASISSPATNVLTLGTNSVERVRVDSGGRLGIGTNIYPNNEMLVVDNVNGNTAYNSKFVFSGTTNTAYCASTWTHGQSGTAVGYAGVGGSNTGNASFRNNFVVGTQNANALVLNTNDTERVRIDSSGRVTMPYQPVFYAYQSGSLATTSTGIFNSTQWNTTLVNTGSCFNTSNGRFTAPVTGVYMFQIKALVRRSSGDGSVEISLYKNGSNVVTRSFGYTYVVGTNDHDSLTALAYISLTVDDYVQMGISVISAGTDVYYGENLASFCGQLVG